MISPETATVWLLHDKMRCTVCVIPVSSTFTSRGLELKSPFEGKIEAKLKFSQFLDEVTSNVLEPNCLRAFGRPVSPSSSSTTNPNQPEGTIQVVTQWSPRLTNPMAQNKPQEERTPPELTQKTYLETDIDTVRTNDEQQRDQETRADTRPRLEVDEKSVIPPPPQFCQGFDVRSSFTESYRDFSRQPYSSASLPRGVTMVSDEEMNNTDAIRVNPGRALSVAAGQA
ncbi:hypothetical protein JOB18_029420 [Solea senegalensis]|uniref:Uncharacterized protein n=1 Tax=Solea senegalensis TaxID=28829 RepID=A0AAV6RTT4_SOLSE|nr:hypothetical protein JOB18_029420 [Solea senegalensis]